MIRVCHSKENMTHVHHALICHDITQLIAVLWVDPDTGLSFTCVFTFILTCLISFSLLSGFILPSPGIDFNKWCTAWWIKQAHQIMFSQLSSWAPWHAASLCEQEQTLWAEVSGLCWGMWRSAIKTSVGPSSCSLCNNKLLWFYMIVKALFHTFLLVRRPWP